MTASLPDLNPEANTLAFSGLFGAFLVVSFGILWVLVLLGRRENE